ncbi:ribose 5-phosphate isomerase B [Selenomonas sp. TAMA-11512]|uniref:RpiB/LacA/LacB family sugar-phosphate isomerase n=1 Tax=Selenomonas sp. TAMA-11512 TaxID=3095337 RepID=UPI00308F6A1D|nr:ribose 5-phosphate isomerase B [Selenomonas sp. TAMA-11512]
MKIAVGCDPNAESYKQIMIEHIKSLGHEVTDFGSEDPIYARVAVKVGEEIAAGHFERGILFCGTGLGVMLAANKVKGIRAAVVHDVYSAKRAVLSNNCQIMTLGSQVDGDMLGKELITAFLNETYVYNERSGKKVDAMTEYEEKGTC